MLKIFLELLLTNIIFHTIIYYIGMVAEWLKAAVLKTVADVSPPQVRILPIPRQALAQLVPIIENRLELTCRIFRHNNW